MFYRTLPFYGKKTSMERPELHGHLLREPEMNSETATNRKILVKFRTYSMYPKHPFICFCKQKRMSPPIHSRRLA